MITVLCRDGVFECTSFYFRTKEVELMLTDGQRHIIYESFPDDDIQKSLCKFRLSIKNNAPMFDLKALQDKVRKDKEELMRKENEAWENFRKQYLQECETCYFCDEGMKRILSIGTIVNLEYYCAEGDNIAMICDYSTPFKLEECTVFLGKVTKRDENGIALQVQIVKKLL